MKQEGRIRKDPPFLFHPPPHLPHLPYLPSPLPAPPAPSCPPRPTRLCPGAALTLAGARLHSLTMLRSKVRSAIVGGLLIAVPSIAAAQTRTTLDQIDGSNFKRLERVWRLSFPRQIAGSDQPRSLPIFTNNKLIVAFGDPLTVVAVRAASGSRVWTFKEPPQPAEADAGAKRIDDPRGIAVTRVGQKDVVVVAAPSLKLYVLDADTGTPLSSAPFDHLINWEPWRNVPQPEQRLPMVTPELEFRPRMIGRNSALVAEDSRTAEIVGSIRTPELAAFGITSYLAAGRQFIVLAGPGGYTALALPHRVRWPAAGADQAGFDAPPVSREQATTP